MKLQEFFSGYRRLILIIVAIIFVSLLARFYTLGVKIESVRNFLETFGLLAPTFYILIFSLGEIIPGGSTINSLLFYAAGLLFRPELAVVYTLTADTLAITINFFLARYFGINLLSKILTRNQLDNLTKFTKTINWELIFLFRLIPFVTTFGIDIVSYAAGLSETKYSLFILATIVPWAIIDIIQFYSINHFVGTANALFLLPVYLLLSIPLVIIILKKRPEHRHYFKNLYDQLIWFKKVSKSIFNKKS